MSNLQPTRFPNKLVALAASLGVARQSVSFVNLAFFLCLAFLRRAISFALDTVTTAVDCFCRCRPVHPAVLARATPLTASVLRLAFVVAEHPWP